MSERSRARLKKCMGVIRHQDGFVSSVTPNLFNFMEIFKGSGTLSTWLQFGDGVLRGKLR